VGKNRKYQLGYVLYTKSESINLTAITKYVSAFVERLVIRAFQHPLWASSCYTAHYQCKMASKSTSSSSFNKHILSATKQAAARACVTHSVSRCHHHNVFQRVIIQGVSKVTTAQRAT